MKKKVILTINGTNNEEEPVKFLTEGMFHKKEDVYYIFYEETEITGMEGTKTTIKVKDDIISLIRHGSINANFKFCKNKEDVSQYQTPYGIFDIKIRANEVISKVDDNGGEIFLEYNLSINGDKPGKYIFEMKIKECK